MIAQNACFFFFDRQTAKGGRQKEKLDGDLTARRVAIWRVAVYLPRGYRMGAHGYWVHGLKDRISSWGTLSTWS